MTLEINRDAFVAQVIELTQRQQIAWVQQAPDRWMAQMNPVYLFLRPVPAMGVELRVTLKGTSQTWADCRSPDDPVFVRLIDMVTRTADRHPVQAIVRQLFRQGGISVGEADHLCGTSNFGFNNPENPT